MKKSLLILFGALLIFQGGVSYAETSEAAGIFSSLKDAKNKLTALPFTFILLSKDVQFSRYITISIFTSMW